MKKTVLSFFFLSVLVGFSPSWAAFPVKKADTVQVSGQNDARSPGFTDTVKLAGGANQHCRHNHPHAEHYNDDRPGWPGTYAMISLYLFFPAAIIFGIIGLNRKYKNRGLALTALIIAGAVTLGIILAIVIVASFL